MRAMWVPLTLESAIGPEKEEILVYRLGDRFKVGLLLAVPEGEEAGAGGDGA
jgi:hypothetical protein